jgi:hypothetical protein
LLLATLGRIEVIVLTYPNDCHFLDAVGEARRLVFRVLLSHVVFDGNEMYFSYSFGFLEQRREMN